MSKFSENLANKRKTMKLTQTEIAKKLNINRVTYTGYETGKHFPDVETLIKIADILETSIDYLVGRYDK